MSSFFSKKINIALGVFALVLAGLYLAHYLQIFFSGEYLATRSDEMVYVMQARAFAENNLLQAMVYDENLAKVFGADVHGPMYPVIYGLLFKIFGFQPLVFIYLNFFLVFASIVLIFKSKLLDLQAKFGIIVTEFSFFLVFWNAFNYTPEVIHIFFANLIALKLIEIYRNPDEKTVNKRTLEFLLLIVLASAFRYSWSLSALGLVFLATNKKEFLKLFAWSFAVVALGFLYNKLCHAEFFGLVMTKIPEALHNGDVQGALTLLTDNISNNLQLYFYKFYFDSYYFIAKYVYVFLMGWFIYKGYKEKNNYNYAVALIALLYFSSMIVFFDAYDFRDLRGMVAPLIIMIYAIYASNYKRLGYICAIVFFLGLLGSYQMYRYLHYDKAISSAQLYKAEQAVPFNIVPAEGKKLITILIPQQMYWRLMPGREPNIKNVLHSPVMKYPLKNNEGVPIRYAYNNTNESPYKLWNKIEIDYIFDAEHGRLIRNVSR